MENIKINKDERLYNLLLTKKDIENIISFLGRIQESESGQAIGYRNNQQETTEEKEVKVSYIPRNTEEVLIFIKNCFKNDYQRQKKLSGDLNRFESEYHSGVQEGKIFALKQAMEFIELLENNL